MQDIYIDKVELKNVRGLREMSMDFPLNNFSAITGKIGTGKTTIFKSISFALFGSDGGLPGETSTLNDMINKKSGKNLEIFLDFRVEENEVKDKYQIKLFGNHSKFQNKFFLFKNGVDISGRTKSSTYEYIERLLIPKNVFFNTVYFGQQIKNFFTSLTNLEQKAIFDSIMSLEEFITYYKKTDESLREVQQKYDESETKLNLILLSIKEKNDFLKTLKDSKEKFLKDLESQIYKFKEEKIKVENEIECLEIEKSNIIFNSDELDSLVQRNSILNSELKNIDSKFEKEINNIKNNYEQQLKNKLESLTNESEEDINKKDKNIFSQKNSIFDRNNEITIILSDISKKYDCSVLEKDKNNFDKEKQKEIQFLLNELNEVNKKFITINYEDEKKIRLTSLNDQLSEIKRKGESIALEAQSIKKDIEKLQKEIREDEESISREVAICSKCKQPLNNNHILDIKKIIESNKNVIFDLTKKLEVLKTQFDQLKKDALELKQLIEKEESKYNNLIESVNQKKKEEIEYNERKRKLIQEEIKDFETQNYNQILSLQEKKEEESSKYKKEKEDNDDKLSLLERELIIFKKNVQDKLEKDMLNVKDEYNKRVSEEVNCIQESIDEEKKNKNKEIYSNSEKINILNSLKTRTNDIILSLQTLKVNLKNIQDKLDSQKSFSFDNSEIDKLEKIINELLDQKNSFTKEVDSFKKELEILRFWKEAFSDSGIKSMLIDSAIPHLNECMRNESEFLCPGIFTVTFDTLKMNKAGDLKDKFSVNIRHNIKGTDNHKLLSGGEKRLIDLCCMKSLRSLSEKLYNKRFHNYFLDETTDSLDADSCNSFCQMLRLLSKDQNITIITHNDPDNMEPDRVFKM